MNDQIKWIIKFTYLADNILLRKYKNVTIRARQ